MAPEIILSAFMFIGLALYLYFYYLGNNNCKSDHTTEIVDDEQVLRFKRAFIKPQSTLTTDDEQKIQEYTFNSNEVLFNADAQNWKKDDIKLQNLIRLGFTLLNKYAADNTSEQCLKISTDIVLRVGAIVNKLYEINIHHGGRSKSKHSKRRELERKKRDDELNSEDDVDTGSEFPEKQINRFTFSIYIPRLMMMYEYIGDNNCIKKYVCHPIITKLIRSLNQSLDKTADGSNMVLFALPRLLSNYLFDPTTYAIEKKSSLFDDLISCYNIVYNVSTTLTDEPKNGIYEDGSCLYHDSVPRYSNFFQLRGFYEDIFAAFGIDYNYADITRTLIEKLFHPTIPYPTFGLYADTGRILKNDMKGTTGIAIMPYIGLGIFKTDNFMFSLRVQRPKIAAYFKPDKNSQDIFALGWIQLRKMYLSDQLYPEEFTWDTLKQQPGIILLQDQTTHVQLTPEPPEVSNIYTKNINSFIGRIPTEEVMFWMNEYQFPKYYDDVIITEMGVVTNNGVEIFYCTNKIHADNKSLVLRVNDPDKSSFLHYEPESDDGSVELTTTGLTMKMVFNKNYSVKINRNQTTNSMEFEYMSRKYSIKVLEKNLNYIVNVTKPDGTIEIFGGSSSSAIKNTFMKIPDQPEKTPLSRSQVTYMYV